MSVKDLRQVVLELREEMKKEDSLWLSSPEEFESQTLEKHKELNEKYSGVFKMLFANKDQKQDSHIERLLYMLQMAERVENKEIAEHDASVAVGQRLVDDIVKPQLKSMKK